MLWTVEIVETPPFELHQRVSLRVWAATPEKANEPGREPAYTLNGTIERAQDTPLVSFLGHGEKVYRRYFDSFQTADGWRLCCIIDPHNP
jgi:hypothetical protein